MNGEFILPKRYNRKFMERLNKRENDMYDRRNIDLDLFNRPRLENPFSEEENDNKKEIDALIKLIPNSKIDKKMDMQCIICLSKLNIGDKESTLPCLHIFHYHCLKKWLYEHRCCPVCKTEISI